MEEKQETNKVKNGVYVIGGAFLVGYILGGAKANRRVTEYYNKGFMDGFEAIISKIK